MKIGELARRTGCEVETIRYYEREGLLRPPARSDGNYRQYGEADVERLSFIRHCRSLDMSLQDIRLLQGFEARDGVCGDIDDLLDRHLLQVEDRLRELQALQHRLQTLRDACGTRLIDDSGDCGILQNLRSSRTCVCHA